MPRFLFLDTMIFLHYKPLEDIDFRSILKADEIVLVIPRITIRELDKHKNVHALPRIRERAKKILLKIEEWQQSGSAIGQITRMECYGSTPAIDFQAHGLNPDWPDDFLVASILQYLKEHHGASVCLVTQDSGPRLSAAHLDIEAVKLDEEYMLPQTVDPLEVENAELKKSLAKLQSALPELVAGFDNGGPLQSHRRFPLKPPPKTLGTDFIKAKLVELADKYPLKS